MPVTESLSRIRRKSMAPVSRQSMALPPQPPPLPARLGRGAAVQDIELSVRDAREANTVTRDTNRFSERSSFFSSPVDHYFAVNEGPGVTVSDHSPVVGGFVLRPSLENVFVADEASQSIDSFTFRDQLSTGVSSNAELLISEFCVMRGAIEVDCEAMAIVFPAPYEAWDSLLQLSGVSSQSRVRARDLKDIAERAEVNGVSAPTHSKRRSQHRSLDVDRVQWHFAHNEFGGLTATLELPDPTTFAAETPTAKFVVDQHTPLEEHHIVLQFRLYGHSAHPVVGNCIVSLKRVWEASVHKSASGPVEQVRFKCVEPLHIQGLPLQVQDPTTGEPDVVTAMFVVQIDLAAST